MGSMRTSITLIDPYFDGWMAHRSLDEASMEKKSQVDDGARQTNIPGGGDAQQGTLRETRGPRLTVGDREPLM